MDCEWSNRDGIGSDETVGKLKEALSYRRITRIQLLRDVLSAIGFGELKEGRGVSKGEGVSDTRIGLVVFQRIFHLFASVCIFLLKFRFPGSLKSSRLAMDGGGEVVEGPCTEHQYARDFVSRTPDRC
jgi:hypothetical protein